ncbi:MAG: S41 family peptidase [Clostridia bacterium]|nr:S41 family peptidase [Clostridia bacterium]
MKNFFKYLAVASITATAVFVACTVFYGSNDLAPDEDGSTLAAKLAKVNAHIKGEYLYDDYDRKAMDEAAVKAYVDALDEPYTHYYDSDEFESYLGEVEDSYVGIGIVISVDEEEDKIVIIAPTEDSPAREAGLLPGDYILAVDGTEYTGDEMDACVSSIRSGKAGTKVKLKTERDGKIMETEIERREISAHSVRSEMVTDNIGYMRLSEFNTGNDGSDEDTYKEFVSNIEELEEKGMEKLILDLRDNPGGVLSVVVKIADYILPEGIVTYTETKTGKRTDYSSDSAELDIPIVVLINGNSASAAEILTGSLKDYDRAEVVGTTSYGKGIVQTVYPFSDGSGMSMTIAKYYTPKGVCIHGIGIEPDHTVELPEKYKDSYVTEIPRDEDTQYKKALELLSKE